MDNKDLEKNEILEDIKEPVQDIENSDQETSNGEGQISDNQEGFEVEDSEKNSNEDNDLKKENENLKDKLLRSLADNENVRKQSEKTRLESQKYGIQPLARELLNVVDNFERALENQEKLKREPLLEGFLLIKKEVLNILEKFKIAKINAVGQSFDANFHQAMFEKPTNDFKPGQVCEIIQEGYLFHDRLLRPALVGVAKEIKESQSENSEQFNSAQEDSQLEESSE